MGRERKEEALNQKATAWQAGYAAGGLDGGDVNRGFLVTAASVNFGSITRDSDGRAFLFAADLRFFQIELEGDSKTVMTKLSCKSQE
ncbi:hypothetical protein Gogos_000287, partial [Gossypium gossypioides]|nr:hypothetical protein [Gossypium gossypioides]